MRILVFLALAFAAPTFAQQQPQQTQTKDSDTHSTAKAEPQKTVILSGVATTARIADPNEPVVFNGHVMRMSDFVAAVSSSTEAVQRLRTPEKHSHEIEQPVPPSKP